MTMVAGGAHHSYALRADGQVAAWGRNYRNELGDGTKTQRTRPVLVQGVTGAVSIGSGRDHGLAALADGTVRAWGHNTSGQLGDGTVTSRASAVTVTGLADARKVSGGAEFSVAISSTGTPPANQPPVARATGSCDQLACSLSGTTSTDTDGTVTGWSWTFGDGTTGTGPNPTHTYASAGTYTVGLTVTDDDGATAATTVQVTATSSPGGTAVTHRASSGTNRNSTTAPVVVPAATEVGDVLVLFVTINRLGTATTPAGWTLLGTASDTDVRSWVYTRTAVAGTAGSTVSVTFDATSKVDATLVVYDGGAATSATAQVETGSGTSHAAPATTVATSGSRVVHQWATKINATATWTLPGGLAARRTSSGGSGNGQVSAVVADGGPVPAGPRAARSATASVSSAKAIAWTVVVAPD
ncbi:PKD domain-containing protein [Nocardioides sp. J54]|uniref:PKD domain-containing protein n=1 Tax=Nocardioides sp. J54 TaxID=935866 RepID=UPI000686A2C3|nr:PKD domain-containing protein [Nocardioides sp. J54]